MDPLMPKRLCDSLHLIFDYAFMSSSNVLFISLTLLFRPKSGSMLLYSRKKVRYRRDGYCWKKRKDGKTTREDHMKLKVQGTEVSSTAMLSIFFGTF